MHNILASLKKSNQELCLHTNGCSAQEISACKNAMLNAHNECHYILRSEPRESSRFSECITQSFERLRGKGSILRLYHAPKCHVMSKPQTLQRTLTPSAGKPEKYFSVNSFDINTLTLYTSGEKACKTGITRFRAANQKNGIAEINISLSGIEQTTSVSGEGDSPYRSLFNTPVYKFGKCTGNSKTRFLKRYAGYQKGAIIDRTYTDLLYVVVDCKSIPKPPICD